MARISKRMKEGAKVIKEGEAVSLEQAMDLISQFPKIKFDETVELHLMLNISVKDSDQNVRGTVSMPHGLGKEIKTAVFCKGELEQKAKDAGADFVGSEELIQKVMKGFVDFDVVIATPDMMRDLSKLGKVLGPRGLMPTPKAGTVTMEIEKAIKEVKGGKIEFKSDKQSGIHIGVGKRSFSKENLLDNTNHLLAAINQAKPTSVKGNLIKNVSISTTMGPGIKVTL